MTKDEFYFFVKKCLSKKVSKKASSSSNEDDDLLKPGNGINNSIVDKLVSDSKTGSDIEVDFFRIMETIEEYQEESTWDPLSVTSSVLNFMLKSSNPASIYELRSLIEGFGILDKDELEVLFNEIRYL